MTSTISRVLTLLVIAAGLVAVLTGAQTSPSPASPVELVETTSTNGGAEQVEGASNTVIPLSRKLARAGAGPFRTTAMEVEPFSLLGATWRGRSGAIWARVRQHGAWGPWQHVPLLTDGPDAGQEPVRRGLNATAPWWVGASDGVQIKVRGDQPRDLNLTLINPGQVASDRATPVAPRTAPRAAQPKRAPMPPVLKRNQWRPNPRYLNGQPDYLPTIKQVHVHHTVTANGYRGQDVPAILRSMYSYHTNTLGWRDIGYNFLIDRFGRIWEGRSGGIGRLVLGAHTLGFNGSSVGISLIGNFETARVSKSAQTSLVQLAAWKLDRFGRNPAGTIKVKSSGSDRFRAGARVTLPVIDGHRDTNETACPGRYAYAKLPSVRQRTAKRVQRFHHLGVKPEPKPVVPEPEVPEPTTPVPTTPVPTTPVPTTPVPTTPSPTVTP